MLHNLRSQNFLRSASVGTLVHSPQELFQPGKGKIFADSTVALSTRRNQYGARLYFYGYDIHGIARLAVLPKIERSRCHATMDRRTTSALCVAHTRHCHSHCIVRHGGLLDGIHTVDPTVLAGCLGATRVVMMEVLVSSMRKLLVGRTSK